ncbi:BAG family molecular chaperone regulator 4-like isoform X3 [Prosopis cineraria]|uniref:BAG family molecular chaperone regulator 4-like isoform X3 n=1 Tax=Prosopis cineraria TaxID=364024 RepID=UPI0024104B57|nr:BAG family molecular chaperone regulator 4-like isoform X3 [Prosopis cineraria]
MSTSGCIIEISIYHNSSPYEVSLPAESTFGDVKRLLAHNMGLEPKGKILIFRGKEKQDREHLRLKGAKDNSELFLFEDPASKGRKLEETRKMLDMSGAFEAVAGVRAEVDQLSERSIIVDRLGSLKEMNFKPSSYNGNACPDKNEETIDSGMRVVIQDLEQLTFLENGEFELRGSDEAMDPSPSDW